MEISSFEAVADVMVDQSAPYWTVYDSTGKRMLNKQGENINVELSVEKLKKVVERERGDFVQVKVSNKTGLQLNEGGNIKSSVFGPYFLKIQPNEVSISGSVNSGAPSSGISFSMYEAQLKRVNDLELEKLKNTYEASQLTGIERFLNSEMGSKLVDAVSNYLGQAFVPNLPKAQLGKPEGENAPEFHESTLEALRTIMQQKDGGQILVNIAYMVNTFPGSWDKIRNAMIENNLLPSE